MNEFDVKRHESDTQIIKNKVRKILKANKEQPMYLRDMRRYISEILGREFTPGVYSSAMRDLMEEENGKVINVDRGVYMYVESVKKHEINEVLDTCIKSLESAAYVDYLSVQEEDIKYLKQIKNMIEVIERMKF